jgi:hypothetical protein
MSEKQMKQTNLSTFVDLYDFLKSYNEPSIISWLEKSWKGKDKQEFL